MPPPNDKSRSGFLIAAAILYMISMHKYVSRNGLDTNAGIQGVLEIICVILSAACVYIAIGNQERRYPPSPAILCFGIYGLFALTSSWRSFNLPLSLAKAIIFFAVIAIGYATSQAGLAIRFFQVIYWVYTASLGVGLALGLALPNTFPLWTIDDYSGRTRLSVFASYPGVVGETSAYLILLSPLLFRRSHWVSRLFLIVMNIMAGGKTSTALLILLLAYENLAKVRVARTWRFVGSLTVVLLLLAAAPVVFLHRGSFGPSFSSPTSMIYGNDVANEAESLDGRTELWARTFQLLIESPALGYGLDGAREALLKAVPWSGQSHNGYFEMGLSGGLVSLAIFLMGVAGVVRSCWYAQAPFKRESLSVLLYMLIIACFGITFTFPSNLGMLVLIFLLYRSKEMIPGGYLTRFTAERQPSLINSKPNAGTAVFGRSGL